MSEMVERMARAIADYWERVGFDPSQPDEGVARAAIEAMRGPTEKMLLAGAGIEPFRVDFIEKAVAKECWHSMIDGALK